MELDPPLKTGVGVEKNGVGVGRNGVGVGKNGVGVGNGRKSPVRALSALKQGFCALTPF